LDQPQSEEDFETRSFLEKCLKGSPGELLRAVPGRETYAVETLRGANWVVKRFNSAWWLRSQAKREFDAISALRALGISVPRPLAYIERGGESLLAMERISSGSTLREALATTATAESERLMAQLLELVLSLHSAGWHHRDLYLHHILVDSRGELVLIDLGRARRPFWVRRRWFAKDIAALLLWTPREVSDRERLRFLLRYMNGMKMLKRGERRRFIMDVLLRRERMARHRPRHGESAEWGPPG